MEGSVTLPYDDVVEVFAVTAALSQVAVLSNPPPHVVVS
jgi:hypothetical protein